MCAERSAMFNMVANGDTKLKEVYIYSPDEDNPTIPCGACMQVMAQFGDAHTMVYMEGSDGEVETKSLKEINPLWI